MRTSWSRFVIAAVAALTLFSAPAYAGSITFSAVGGGPGSDDSATAAFSWGGGVLDITLTNSSFITSTGNVLAALLFITSGGTGLSLGSVTPAGILLCNAGVCGPGAGSSPYTWASIPLVSGEYLFAGTGGGAFQPYGIVNPSIVANAGLDGLSNAQLNPYLLGPVLLANSYIGDLTGITAVNFYFFGRADFDIVSGTVVPEPEPVPEPASLVLVGTGLLALRSRRRNGTRS